MSGVRQPLAEDTGLTIQKRINTSALYIHKMKWFARAILPVVLLVSGLLVDTSVSAQPCGPGKIDKTIRGFGSIITVDNAYNGNTGINALGGPDGNGAYFTNNGQYIVIDLLDTIRVGQTYSIIWRQYPGISGNSLLWYSESVDGIVFNDRGNVSTFNERYFSEDIVAANPTRYIRIYMQTGTADFNVDAISYTATKCYSDDCGAGYSPQLISGNGTYTAGNSIIDPTFRELCSGWKRCLS